MGLATARRSCSLNSIAVAAGRSGSRNPHCVESGKCWQERRMGRQSGFVVSGRRAGCKIGGGG